MAATVTRIGPTLYFDIDIDFGHHIVAPYGNLDTRTSPLLRAAVVAFTAEFPGDLTIDLANVVLADSSVLAVLIELRMRLSARHSSLKLINAPPSVRYLASDAGIRQVLS